MVKNNALLTITSLLCFCVGVYLHLNAHGNFGFTGSEYAQRDIYRAINLLNFSNVPLAGPEGSNGGRLPGTFLYFLYSTPLAIFDNILFINYFVIILNISLLTYVLFLGFENNLKSDVILSGHRTIFLITSALLSIHVLVVSTSELVLNPSFILFFSVIAQIVLIRGYIRNDFNFLLSILIIILCLQLHFSTVILLLSALFLILIKHQTERKNFYLIVRPIFGKIGAITFLFFALLILLTTVPFLIYYTSFFEPNLSVEYIIGIPPANQNELFNLEIFGKRLNLLEVFRRLISSVSGWEIITRIWDISNYSGTTKYIPYNRLSFEPLSFQFFLTIIALISYYYVAFRGFRSIRIGEGNSTEIDKLSCVTAVILFTSSIYFSLFQPQYVYRYILFLIFPSALSIGIFVYSLMERYFRFKIIITSVLALILLANAFETYIIFKNKNIEHERNVGGSLKSTRAFHSNLIKTLGLNKTDYLSKVYFCNNSPNSIFYRNRPYIPYSVFEVGNYNKRKKFENTFELSGFQKESFVYILGMENSERDNCQNLVNKLAKVEGMELIETSSIDVEGFDPDPITKSPLNYTVYKYSLDDTHPTYSNSGDPFYQTQDIKSLLKTTNRMKKANESFHVRNENIKNFQESKTNIFDLDINFLINQELPVKLRLYISKINSTLYSEVTRYYFYTSKNQIKEIKTKLVFKNNADQEYKLIDSCGLEAGDANIKRHSRRWAIDHDPKYIKKIVISIELDKNPYFPEKKLKHIFVLPFAPGSQDLINETTSKSSC